MADFKLSAEVNFQINQKKIQAEVDKLKSAILKVNLDIDDKSFKNLFKDKIVKVKLKVDKTGLEGLVKKVSAQLNSDGTINLDSLGKSVAKSGTSSIDTLLGRLKAVKQNLADIGKRSDQDGFTQFFDKIIGKINEARAAGESVNFEKIFGGLSGTAASNLLKSVELVFNEIERLNRSSKQLESQGLLTPEISKNIVEAQKRLEGLVQTFNAANPSTFTEKVKTETASVRREISELTRGAADSARSLERLQTSTQSDLSRAETGFGNEKELPLLRQRLSLIQAAREAGKSYADTINSSDFIVNEQDLRNLEITDKRILSIEKSYNNLVNKAASSGLFDTDIAKATDLRNRLETLRKTALINTNSVINDPSISGNAKNIKVDRILKEYTSSAKQAVDETEFLNAEINKLIQAQTRFNQGQLSGSAGLTQGAINQVLNALDGNRSFTDIQRILAEANGEITAFAAKEVKVKNVTDAFERLRITLQPIGDDIAGVGKIIDRGIDQVGKLNLGDAASERSIKNISAEISFQARQAAKLNKTFEEGRSRLEQLGDASSTQLGSDAFAKAGVEFQKSASKIINGQDSLVKKNFQLNKLMKETVALAQFDARGGLFGTLGASAGLAVKRLGAFLLFAQGLYQVQAALGQSISAVGVLDAEFIKLEQILSKTYDTEVILQQQTDSLTRSILNLSKVYGVLPEEVSSAAKIFAQAGIVGEELSSVLSAVAKADLGPTFDNIGETAESAVAILNQFNLNGRELETVLGGINRVAATFPVEAEGIAKAVRKAGGAFSGAGGEIDEFVAAFTTVKARTREADEAIATGLRNIVIRLQRTSNQQFLKDFLGANLIDDGVFVGPIEGLKRITEALKAQNIVAGDPRFAKVIEQLAGARQFARLQPILQNFEQLEKIQREFGQGAGSLDEDVSRAFGSIENKLTRARAAITELFTEFGRSDLIKNLIELFTQLTTALTNVVRNVDKLVLSFAGLAAARGAFPFLRAGKIQFLGGLTGGSRPQFRNRGGLIPGGGPNRDSVPAMLTTGEYVINRQTVKKFGSGFFDNLQGFNRGGSVGIGVTGAGLGLLSALPLFSKEFSESIGSLTSGLLEIGLAITVIKELPKFVNDFKRSTDKASDSLDTIAKSRLAREKRFGTAQDRFNLRTLGSGNPTFNDSKRFVRESGILQDGAKPRRRSRLGSRIRGLATVENFGIVAAAAGVALKSFAESIKASQEEIIKSTVSVSEAIRASDRLRNSQLVSAAGGALSGAGIGIGAGFSVGGPIGAVIGGVGGAIAGAFPVISESKGYKDLTNSFSNVGSALSSFASKLVGIEFGSEFFSGTIGSGLSAIDSALSQYLPGYIGNFFRESEFGQFTRRSFARNQANLNGASRSLRDSGGALGAGTADRIFQSALGLATQIEASAAEGEETFEQLKPALAEQANRLVEIFNALSPQEATQIIQTAKDANVDLVKLFDQIGVDVDLSAAKAKAAFERSSLFFAQVSNLFTNATAQVQAIEANLDSILDPNITNVRSQDIDLLSQGFTPALFGRNSGVKNLLSQLGNLGDNIGNEFDAAIVSREVENAIISQGEKISLNVETTAAEAYIEFLSEAFAARSTNRDLNNRFQDYLEETFSSDQNLISGGGLGLDDVQKIFKGFRDKFAQGGAELLSKINDLTNNFAQSSAELISKINDATGNISNLKLNNVSLSRRRLNLFNPQGISGSQAQTLDDQSLNAILSGLNVGKDVSSIQNALISSQNRQFAGRGDPRVVATEQGIQNRLTKALEFIAGGTDSAAFAIKNFEEAISRATAASDRFSGAITGDASQLDQALKGQLAFSKIVSASSQGEAVAILSKLSEASRSGLNQLIGSDDQRRLQFQQRLGIAPSIANLPQAADANKAFDQQKAANDALISAQENAIKLINTQQSDLSKVYSDGIIALSTGVNQFGVEVNKLASTISNIPNQIGLQVAGTIDVRFIGAESLSKMQESLRGFISNEVATGINNLVKQNRGLRAPNNNVKPGGGVTI